MARAAAQGAGRRHHPPHRRPHARDVVFHAGQPPRQLRRPAGGGPVRRVRRARPKRCLAARPRRSSWSRTRRRCASCAPTSPTCARNSVADVRATSVLALGPAKRTADLLLLDPPYASGAGACWTSCGGWAGSPPARDLAVVPRGEVLDVKGFELDATRDSGKAGCTCSAWQPELGGDQGISGSGTGASTGLGAGEIDACQGEQSRDRQEQADQRRSRRPWRCAAPPPPPPRRR